MRAEATSLPALLRRRSTMPGTARDAPGTCVYPNRTLYNVETPDCYLRRFTPDGKYLVGFGRNMSGLHVFRVQSPSASAQQLVEAGTVANKSEFWHFFKLAWSRSYTGFGEALHRDLCLVTQNMRHLIIVRLRRTEFGPTTTSTTDRQQQQQQQPTPQYPNALSCIKAMEDITIMVVALSNGEIVDQREYPNDIIYLSGHNGISLYEDKLCFLSLKNQCLRILRINSDGTLVDEREIGWHTQPDDAYYDSSLCMREEQYLASLRERALRRKRNPADSQGFRGCLDEADIPLAIKRQKISQPTEHETLPPASGLWITNPAHSSHPQVYLTPASLDSGPAEPRHGSSFQQQHRALSSSVMHPVPQQSPSADSTSAQAYDVHCPEMPTNSFMSSATSVCFSSGSTGDRLPFIFPLSAQTQQGPLAAENEIDDALAPMQSNLVSGGSSRMNSLAESLNPLLAMTSDRAAAFMPLQALQRLPPHYRLMFTRAMQPSGRLESLADSDIPLIEPSLTSAPYSGLKQRLLGALFMRAKNKDDSGLSLKYFYRTFRQYEGLVLWRAQFVTRNRLLLRFVPLQVATSRSHVPRSSVISSSTMANSFTVLAEYDIAEARFARIWDTADRDLYQEVESRLDVYRAPMAPSSGSNGVTGSSAPSSSNDIYLRDSFEFTQSAIRTARSGGPVQAARKASALLPFAPQCTQESPILSPSRFKCNLRVRQMIERFRPASMSPIRFYDRSTGKIKFVLSPTPYHSSPPLPEDDPAALHPLALTGSLDAVRGVLPSGAVLMPSGGAEDMNIVADTNGNGTNGSSNSSGSSSKAGIMYLLHPFLPLVLSTRSDNGPNTMPVSNIHFWRG